MTTQLSFQSYQSLFSTFSQLITQFDSQLQPIQFEKRTTETYKDAYSRGCSIFKDYENELIVLETLLSKEKEIHQFFNKCKGNKEIVLSEMNYLISKLIDIKKQTVNQEEWIVSKNEWNSKRKESLDQKNRRECEEILLEIKEEKKQLKEMKELFEEMKKMSLQQIELKKQIDMLVNALSLGIENELNKAKETKENDNDKEKEISNENNNLKEIQQVKELNDFSISTETKQKNEIQNNYPFLLTPTQQHQLETWTSLKCSQILFNSTTDSWAKDTSLLNEKIIGKKNLAFVIFTSTDIFGYFCSPQISNTFFTTSSQSASKKSFLFNLESNGRLSKPMKFEVKNLSKGGISLFKKDDEEYSDLITLGEIYLDKEEWKDDSNIEQHENIFNYHGIKNALCSGEKSETGEIYFSPKQFIIIQMN